MRALPILAAMTGNIGVKGGSTGMAMGGASTHGQLPGGRNPIRRPSPCTCGRLHHSRQGDDLRRVNRIKGADKLNQNMKFMLNWGNALINQHSDVNGTAKILQDEEGRFVRRRCGDDAERPLCGHPAA